MKSLATQKINVNISQKKQLQVTLLSHRNKEIAENFNKYFTNIGPNLASEIPNKQGFEKNLENCNTVMNDDPLTKEKLRTAFFSLEDY